jgi:two-component system chemotaxis response regulator CheY
MKKTVLIVDDFENTRWVIANSLQKKLEINILQAGNGKEAIKYFDGRRHIDLLITDLNMPEMDGIELVKNIRNNQKYGFIPIIMLTTERSMEKQKNAEDAQVTMWVKKPFDQKEFLVIVSKCLNQASR